jgi:hypothetical protein
MDRYARTPREEIVSQPERVPTVAQGPAEKVLAMQRGIGNRAVASMLARRVIGNDSSTRIVHLTVGVELTTKLAQRAWELTAKGPLDEAGVETLRKIALEHWFGTIDDDERLFIAALLDPGNAAKLHTTYPRGFSDEGSVIEFDATSITSSNRRMVQDSGRNKRPAPDASDKAFTKDPLDQDILAMGHPGFDYTVRQVLKNHPDLSALRRLAQDRLEHVLVVRTGELARSAKPDCSRGHVLNSLDHVLPFNGLVTLSRECWDRQG